MDRRLALVWAFIPSAFIAYACSDDPATETPVEPDGGGSTSSSSTSSSSGSTSSSSGGPTDGGDEGGDAGVDPTACIGNPLSPDGGTPDGGVILNAGDGGASVRTAVVTPATFLDGPVYTDIITGGALVYSEVFGLTHRIVHVGPDGGVPTNIRVTPMVGGTKFLLPVGNAIKGSTILTAATEDPNAAGPAQEPAILQTLPDGSAGPNLVVGAANDPNDLVVTKGGVIFFTDPAFQTPASTATGVYRHDGGAGVTLVKGYTGATSGDRPDGIALSPDEKTLYVSFGLNRRIERFTIDANGNATAAANFAAGAAFVDNPEGLATDAAGNVWVAESPNDDQTNGGRVSVFDPTGKKWGEIRFPDHRPIAVAFGGGADNKALYVVANRATGGGYDGHIFIYPSRCSGTR